MLTPISQEWMYLGLVTPEPGNPRHDPADFPELFRERTRGFSGRLGKLSPRRTHRRRARGPAGRARDLVPTPPRSARFVADFPLGLLKQENGEQLGPEETDMLSVGIPGAQARLARES